MRYMYLAVHRTGCITCNRSIVLMYKLGSIHWTSIKKPLLLIWWGFLFQYKTFQELIRISEMRRRRGRIIYNPTSGKELFRAKLPDILQIFEQGGFETSCYATQRMGDGIHAAREASLHEFDLVVAAGGD